MHQAQHHVVMRDYAALWDAATAEERAAATALVDATRAAATVYADYDAALATGYVPNGHEERATHHPNRALMRDGRVLDPDAPESLVYWNAPSGEKVLVGVVYKAAAGESAPAPGGDLTAWHTHTGPGELCLPEHDDACPDDTMKMLHVFFFEDVQDPFAESMASAAGGRGAFLRAMARERRAPTA